MVEENKGVDRGKIERSFSFKRLAHVGYVGLALLLAACSPKANASENIPVIPPTTAVSSPDSHPFHTSLNSAKIDCTNTHNHEESLIYVVPDNQNKKLIEIEMSTKCLPNPSTSVVILWGRSDEENPEGGDALDRTVPPKDEVDISIVHQGGNRWNVILVDNNGGFAQTTPITMSQFNPNPIDAQTCTIDFSVMQSKPDCTTAAKN